MDQPPTVTDQTPDEPLEAPLRRRRRGRLGLWPVVWALTVSALIAVALMSASGAPLRMPGWAVARIEARLGDLLPVGDLRLGGAVVQIGTEGVPRVSLRNVEITDMAGTPVAQVNELGAGFSLGALLSGRVEPEVLRVSGAQITVRRNSAGDFTLAFGAMGGGAAATGTLAGVLDAIDRFFATGAMAEIGRIEAGDLTITLEDARSGRVWQATGGTLYLDNEADGLAITVASEVFNGTEDLARVQLSFRSDRGSPAASLGVTFEDAAAADIALQSPALAVLGLLDANISGSLRATVDPAGSLGQLAATLEIGDGTLRQSPEAQPIGFDRARAYMRYNPATGRIAFTEVSATSDRLSVIAEGQAFLEGLETGWPRSLVGQFRVNDLAVNAGELFEMPLRFGTGRADFRLTLDPFSVDIGQLVLDDGEAPRRISGGIAASEEGWTLDLDLATDRVSPERMIALWPVVVAPGTRRWVQNNVQGGTVADLRAAIRKEPGARPVATLGYRFEDAEVTVMRHFPPIRGGAGVATLFGDRYAMELFAGGMTAADGASADLAGSRFVVPDVRIKPAAAEVLLAAAGPLDTVLRLMNNRPFLVLDRSGRSDDLLAARAASRFDARIRFPLRRGLTPADVAFDVDGTLTGVSAQSLVPGRVLEAEELRVSITPEALQVTGEAELSDLPVRAAFTQPLAPGGQSEVVARTSLSEETLRALGVALPAGAVRGAAEAEIRLELVRDAPATFRLTSDLAGATLTVPAIGWSKAAATGGALEVTGRIAEGAVEVEALSLAAPGLSATGTIAPGDGPGLATTRFDRLRVGTWFDAPVTLRGRGPGRPAAIAITGGTLDLRGLPGGGRGVGGSAPLRLDLDTLRVSDTIALSPFRAELVAGQGLNGSFEARMNGGAPVRGSMVPMQNGTGFRVLAEDGGAVLRDAGIFRNARQGALELRLVPRQGRGAFDGQLRIDRVRLRNAPALAGLLDAVSIVGIIDQLEGPGILFDTVEARFDMTPDRVVVREGSAVGASLGISMDGVYEIASKRMDMQGVISPIYILNGIGQVLTRPGEGLFGFSFRMTGVQGNARVQVNPLSILTPGMFREIFRRPAPVPTE